MQSNLRTLFLRGKQFQKVNSSKNEIDFLKRKTDTLSLRDVTNNSKLYFELSQLKKKNRLKLDFYLTASNL
jgi:hypothetical protein